MTLYEAFKAALASLDLERRIFCGFSANVDVIVPFAGDDFLEIQRRLGPFPPESERPPDGNLRAPADVARVPEGREESPGPEDAPKFTERRGLVRPVER